MHPEQEDVMNDTKDMKGLVMSRNMGSFVEHGVRVVRRLFPEEASDLADGAAEQWENIMNENGEFVEKREMEKTVAALGENFMGNLKSAGLVHLLRKDTVAIKQNVLIFSKPENFMTEMQFMRKGVLKSSRPQPGLGNRIPSLQGLELWHRDALYTTDG
ncbi:hypothetical protein LSAT2_010047 [Lamellibrachia satsuma]|nr:hypothetical protein LSAT2_010047 [Lamellibrachia satsuma]